MEIKDKQRIIVPEEVDTWLRSRYMNTYAEGHRECWDEFTYYREDSWPANEWEMRMEPYAAIKYYKEFMKEVREELMQIAVNLQSEEHSETGNIQDITHRIQNYIENGTE